MKKLLSIILAAAMALSLMCSSLNAAEIDQTEPQTVLPEFSDNSEPENGPGKVTEPVIGTDEESDVGTKQEPIADEQGSDADADLENAGEPPTSEEIAPPMLMATAEDNAVSATNGQCGDAAYWDYDPDTQTLTISGTGDMWDFNGRTSSYDRIDPPWDNEEFVISNLVISDGITSIGENAFYVGKKSKADYEFTSVNLPSALTKIGNHAFYHSNLTSIALPSTLIKIGDSAFYGSKLVSVHIPGTVKTIDYNAFGGCSMLSNVILDEGITDIKAGAFDGTAIESIVIPESVLAIGTYEYCKNLSQIHLPSKLTEIQYAAFSNCTSLGTVTIPAAVESIGDFAFRSSPDQVISFDGDAPTLEEYVVTEEYEGYNSGSFDLTDTLVYNAANSESWTGSADFDPRYNTYCGYKTEVQGVCNHSGSKYVYDQYGHALVCDICGRGYGFEEHSYGANGKCACGYFEHEHSWEWQADEYSHYKVCTLCGQILESGLHKLSSSECLCTECGQTVHIYDYSGHNDEAHWKVCRRCKEKYDSEVHTFNDNKYRSYYQDKDKGHCRECDNCGYTDESEIFPHTSKNEICVNTDLDSSFGYYYGHYYECDVCGEAYCVPHTVRLLDDFSGFTCSDILGLPEDEAVQILKEYFGEENVELNNDYNYYHVRLSIGTECTKCGMSSVSTLMPSGNISILVYLENGLVSHISNWTHCYAFSSQDPNKPINILEDDSRSPKTVDNLPCRMSVSELKKYAASGTATLNGVTFDVKVEEFDATWTGLDGAKTYYYDFYYDDYYGSYDISNYISYYDGATSSTIYELVDIDDTQLAENAMVYATKKFTPGDVNNDGDVTLDDAILTLKKAMNVDIGSETFIAEAAEVTGDGQLSLEDAIGVLKKAMGVN